MLLVFPLMILPLAIYNILAIGGQMDWLEPIFTVTMVSGTPFVFDFGDMLLTAALVTLFLEVLKATRTGAGSIIDHLLSTAVFVAALVEFLLVDFAATSTFFLLMLMSLFDVIAGFSITIRSARRDVALDHYGGGPF